VLILLVIISGIGYSGADVMINGMVPELFPKYKNTLIPLLHAFFGTGAMVTPIIITNMVSPDAPSTFGRPFLLFGISAIAAILILAAISRRIIPETRYADMSVAMGAVSGNPAEIFKSGKAWMVLGASFLYFSFQIGLMSWLPTFCQELGMDFGTAGMILTSFFAGSLAMRFCSPLILRKFAVRKVYILLTLIASVAIAAALLTSDFRHMMPLMIFGGFMQGACVSLLVLMAIEAFPKKSASASSLVFIAANVASMTAPLWIGALAEFIGFRTPLLIVCGFLAISAFLVCLLGRGMASDLHAH